MNVSRWEYAVLLWDISRRRITRSDPEWERLPPEERDRWDRAGWEFYWWREHKAYIWMPGDKVGTERLLWEEWDPTGPGTLGILNELGSDGWELVAITNDDTTMTPSENRGWQPTSFPVLKRYHFKRLVPPESVCE